MLWRVRTALPDRPGALAGLAHACGAAQVNILAVQVFPGVEAVTDELVVSTPDEWVDEHLQALIESAGCEFVSAMPSDESALLDQPARYVQAARSILARPARFPEVVAGLFDAESDPAVTDGSENQDVLEMTVGDVDIQVRRAAPFTATEHARAAALAGLVNDVLDNRDASPPATAGPGPGDDTPEFVAEGDAVVATVGERTVGSAVLLLEAGEPGVREVRLHVDPAWRRRGIGARLLLDIAKLARGRDASEILIVTAADNSAVLPMVMSAGLRARIRMAADVLTVRVPVRELKPVDR
ncbi:MAG: GNAT family N-acetyltransferase [Nocardioides sp.]